MNYFYKLLTILLFIFTLLNAYSYFGIIVSWMESSFFTSLPTMIGLTFTLLHAGLRQGWKNALIFFTLSLIISLLFEGIGVATGLIYGHYHYTDKLGPLFLGLVPYLIPGAWFLMIYPSYILALWIVPARIQGWKYNFAIAAIAGLIMTSWDTVMDPGMVANGYWVWETEGVYFGIPLQNFWGWWLTTFSVVLLYTFISQSQNRSDIKTGISDFFTPRFDRLVVINYSLIGLMDVLSTFLGGIKGPAIIGTFAMTPWIVLSYLKMNSSKEMLP